MKSLEDFHDLLVGENFSEATLVSYTRTIKQLLELLDKEPEDISKDDLNKFKVWANKTMKYDTNSLIPKYSAVNKFLEFLGKDFQLPIPKKQVKNKVPFTREEIKRLFEVSKDNPRDNAILKVLYYTQLRRDELIHLNIDDIDFERGKIRVNDGKGGNYSTINIHPDALKAILDYLKVREPSEERALFISNQGNRISKTPLQYLIDKYARMAGITKRAYCHLFRISSITHMSENGCNLEEIRQQSRHADYKTLQGYINMSEEHVKSAYMKGLSFEQEIEIQPTKVVQSSASVPLTEQLVQKLISGEIDKDTFKCAVSLLGHKQPDESNLTGYL